MDPETHAVFAAAIDFAWRSAAAFATGSDPLDLLGQLDGAAEHASTIQTLHRRFFEADAGWLGMPADQHRAVCDALHFAWLAGATAKSVAMVHALETRLRRRERFRSN